MSEHLSEIEIADYVDDPGSHPRRAEIESHAAECSECGETLNAARSFDAEMANIMVWEFMLAAKRRASAVPASLVAKAQQIDAEAREAAEYLDIIVMSPMRLKRAAIAAKPAMWTAGVVRLLCEASRRLREMNPKHALTVADEAIAVSGRLSPQRYDEPTRCELRGAGWLERANALRYLGDFPGALHALDLSQAEYHGTPLNEWPLAMVDYVRSVIYMVSERLTEAMQLARDSAAVFRRYGDETRYVHALLVTGGCLFQSQQYMLARDLFRRLLPRARATGEPATVARCLNNLANAEMELGEFGAASEHLGEAAAGYERLGMRTELLRARWGAAVLAMRMGNIGDGIARLRKTAGEMLDLGLTNDHARVMLDAAQALFAVGELRELPAICAQLVRVFSEAGMPENARMALAYLDGAVRAGAVTEPLIHSVKSYIDREDYGSPFIPPPA